MTQPTNQVYEFADLSEYSFKERLLIRLASLVFFFSIKLCGLTTRFEVKGWEHIEAIEAAGHKPIIGFWHNRIFLGTYFFRKRGIVVMTSRSFDGEYIARFIQRFGYGAIRGSSSRGASRALIEMIRGMRSGLAMSFTLDGPRGPRYRVKPGAVILAKKTGNPIVPFLVESKRHWALKSWDKMQIPMPFSRALALIGEPIYVASNASEREIEAKVAELQNSLDDLIERGKQWGGKGS